MKNSFPPWLWIVLAVLGVGTYLICVQSQHENASIDAEHKRQAEAGSRSLEYLKGLIQQINEPALTQHFEQSGYDSKLTTDKPLILRDHPTLSEMQAALGPGNQISPFRCEWKLEFNDTVAATFEEGRLSMLDFGQGRTVSTQSAWHAYQHFDNLPF